MERKIKNSLFGLLVFLLTLPAIQYKFRWYPERTLKGFTVDVQKPELSAENWFGGYYQQEQEKYLTNYVGFRPVFIRVYNEYQYDLFDEISVRYVVRGKNGYLYEDSYISTYLGQDFIGKDSVERELEKLQLLKQKLQKQGVHLLLVLTPGKATYLPEFLPDSYQKEKRTRSNYEEFSDRLKEYDVDWIDFQNWAIQQKKHAPYPLMAKTGIHWSKYYEYQAADSIFSYLDHNWDIHLPRTILDSVVRSYKMEDTDDDIEQSLNLLHNLPDLEMGYPRFHFSRSGKQEDPSILVIGDSFYFGIFELYKNHLRDRTFWYYNKEIYPQLVTPPIDPVTLNLKDELKKRKVVIILSTDSNLKNFGFGFIERALKDLD